METEETKITVKEFIGKYISKHKTVKELLNDPKLNKEFAYERLWDICIKFGITSFTQNYDNVLHGFGNINYIHDDRQILFHKLQNKIDDYLNEKYISSKSGGYSDISFETIKDNIRLLNLISVKYFLTDDKHASDYDVQKLCIIVDNVKNRYDEINTLIFVENKKKVIEKLKKANKSSAMLLKYISPSGNFENIYDVTDLQDYYIQLRKLLELYDYFKYDAFYNLFKKQYLHQQKQVFKPKFHQELFIKKSMNLINKGNKKILIGAIPRSGKTFIFAGLILEHIIKYTEFVEENAIETEWKNYLIITPAPTETIKQYQNVFQDYIDFENKMIKVVDITDKKSYDSHTIRIISKQKICNCQKNEDNSQKMKEKIDKFLNQLHYDMIFIDEAHFGMSTDLANKMLELIDMKNFDAIKVFITATYNKPQIRYNIEDKQKLTWDLNDVHRLKKFCNYNNDKKFEVLSALGAKFGKKVLLEVLKTYGWNTNIINEESLNDENNKKIINQISKEYNNFPEAFLITSTWDSNFLEAERKKIQDSDFSFDMEKLFTPKTNDKFENEEQVREMLHYYFGYPDKKKTYSEQIFYKQRGIIPRIENICNNNCRTLQDNHHKTSQLWFLPYGTGRHINQVINALLILLKNSFPNIFKQYMFYVAIDKESHMLTSENVIYMQDEKNIKEEITNTEKAIEKNKEYNGLIILAGGRLQLGISLPNVDIVALFTNITSSDAIYQMMFRSMTEIDSNEKCDGSKFCPNKKYGFMVDLNTQRTLITLNYLADELISNKDKGIKNVFNVIADLINIDRDVFVDKYSKNMEMNKAYTDAFFDKLYSSWDLNVENLKSVVKEFKYNDSFLQQITDDINEIFKESKESRKKTYVIKPDDALLGKKISIQSLYKLPKQKKQIDTKEIIANIMSEVISMLTIFTAYNGLECALKNDRQNVNIEFEINKLMDVIEADSILYSIFISALKDRVFYDNVPDEYLFNFVKVIIANINKDMIEGGTGILSVNKLISSRKSKMYNIREIDKLLEFVADNLKPKQVEKKDRGEVFTPMHLVNEMLDKLPVEVWKDKDLKWLDPAAGMGNFPIAVYIRLMEGLKDAFKDEEKRRKHILENMLYMVEINKKNVFMLKKILCGNNYNLSGNNYNLNIFEGSFITNENVMKIMKNDKSYINVKAYNTDIQFNIILGNPPYQIKTGKDTYSAIWQYFVLDAFKIMKPNGYLLFVNPSGWRDVSGDFDMVKKAIYDRNLMYLEIHNEKDGLQVFDSETRYDIILLQNQYVNKTHTKIAFQDGIIRTVNIKHLQFIPNGQFDFINSLLAKTKEEKLNLLYDACSYHTQKKWMNSDKTSIFKYPCIYTIDSLDKPTFKYSSMQYIKEIKLNYKNCMNKNQEHVGIPKLIWSNGRISSVGSYLDNGNYALTQFAYAILNKNIKELKIIKKIFDSEKFRKTMEYCSMQQLSINYKVLALFKKDFYKYFIEKRNAKSVSPLRIEKSSVDPYHEGLKRKYDSI
jgi:hypothetical protein